MRDCQESLEFFGYADRREAGCAGLGAEASGQAGRASSQFFGGALPGREGAPEAGAGREIEAPKQSKATRRNPHLGANGNEVIDLWRVALLVRAGDSIAGFLKRKRK
jgi:hypothetical protein